MERFQVLVRLGEVLQSSNCLETEMNPMPKPRALHDGECIFAGPYPPKAQQISHFRIGTEACAFFAYSYALTPPFFSAEDFVSWMLLCEMLMWAYAYRLPARDCWVRRGSRKISERHGTDLSKSVSPQLQLITPTLQGNGVPPQDLGILLISGCLRVVAGRARRRTAWNGSQ